MDKKNLSETDIITKFILPAVINAGWVNMLQVRQEVKQSDQLRNFSQCTNQ